MKNRGPKFDISDGDFIFGDGNLGLNSLEEMITKLS